MRKNRVVLKLSYLVLVAIISFVPPLFCYASINRYVISGGQNDKVVTLEELLFDYELYSSETEQVRNKYSLNRLSSDLLNEQNGAASETVEQLIASMNTLSSYKKEMELTHAELIQEYNKQLQEKESDDSFLEELKSKINVIQSQILEIENQISKLNVSLSTAISELESSTLEANLQEFYGVNISSLQEEEINRLNYDFLSKSLSLILIKEQINYYEHYERNLETRLKVGRLKESYGLGNNVDLSTTQLAISKNETNQKALWESYKAIEDYVRAETMEDKSTLIIEYSEAKINYSLSTLQENFIEKSMSYLQLEYAIKAYQNYLRTSSLRSSTAIQHIEKTIESYYLQKKLLFKELNNYVKSQKDGYDKVYLKLINAKQELAHVNQQYDIVNVKYNHGRATLLDVQEKQLLKQQAWLNYYECVVKKIQLEYILEHCIYGVAVEK